MSAAEIAKLAAEIRALGPLSIAGQEKARQLADAVADFALGDVAAACAADALQTMWSACFHAPIEALRRRPGGSGGAEMARLLASATAFVSHLVARLQTRYGAALGLAVPLADDSQSQQQQQLPSTTTTQKQLQQTATTTMGCVAEACMRCCMFLGDLARYAAAGPAAATPHMRSAAREYYSQAHALLPGHGMPHNQLGTCDYNEERLLAAAYRYALGAASVVPAVKARDNLAMVLRVAVQQAPKRQRRSPQQQQQQQQHGKQREEALAEALLLLLAAALGFSAGDTGRLAGDAAACLEDFLHTPSDGKRRGHAHDHEPLLVEATVLAIYAVHTAASATAKTAARRWLLDFVARVASACEDMPPCGGVTASVHAFLCWVAALPGENLLFCSADAGDLLSSSWARAWDAVVGLVNSLIASSNSAQVDREGFVLPEELDLVGFEPVSASVIQLPDPWIDGVIRSDRVLTGDRAFVVRKEAVLRLARSLASLDVPQGSKRGIHFIESEARFAHSEPPRQVVHKQPSAVIAIQQPALGRISAEDAAAAAAMPSIPSAQSLDMSLLCSAPPASAARVDDDDKDHHEEEEEEEVPSSAGAAEKSITSTPMQAAFTQQQSQPQQATDSAEDNAPFAWLRRAFPVADQPSEQHQHVDFVAAAPPRFSVTASSFASPIVNRHHMK